MSATQYIPTSISLAATIDGHPATQQGTGIGHICALCQAVGDGDRYR
jgi:hypothetical protein